MNEEGHSTPEDERVFRLRDDALDWLEVDEEVIVLDGKQDLYLGTNPSGAMLWRKLGTGATRSQLVQLLIEMFDIDYETASTDTDAFLTALSERDLLVEI